MSRRYTRLYECDESGAITGLGCATCGEIKHPTSFAVRSAVRFGREYVCKLCASERRKRYHYPLSRRARRARLIAAARAFMKQVRATTTCRRCGGSPVEFHRDEHVARPLWRVHSLTGSGATIHRLRRELAACEPLCRRCHMTVDGRLAAASARFIEMHRRRTTDAQKTSA